jgi:hypothetical protein
MITDEIGLNAGKIWRLLNDLGDHSINELKKKLKLTERDIYMALGWLTREAKIFHFEINGEWLVCLKD